MIFHSLSAVESEGKRERTKVWLKKFVFIAIHSALKFRENRSQALVRYEQGFFDCEFNIWSRWRYFMEMLDGSRMIWKGNRIVFIAVGDVIKRFSQTHDSCVETLVIWF